MVAIKPSNIKSLIENPPDMYQAFLVYGVDTGMAMEYAVALVKVLTKKMGAGTEIISLGETDFIDQPDRLNVEAKTLSLFGENKIIRVRMNKNIKFPLIEELIKQRYDAHIIIEAGNLKKTDKLVKLFTARKNTATIACYADNARNISVLIDEVLSSVGCTIKPDARNSLVSLLGNDRAVSRSELEKLVLYTGENSEVTHAHIQSILGDSSQLLLDDIAFGLASGQFKKSHHLYQMMTASGMASSTVLIAINRHFLRLHMVIAKREKNIPLINAINLLRPPVHFMKKAEFEVQCKKWTLKRLNFALSHIQSCTRSIRQSTMVENSLVEQLFISLCRISK